MIVVERFVTKNVFRALFAIHMDNTADSTGFRFSDLEGRLSEADRDLLSTVVFADEVLEEEKAAEQALACLRSLKEQDPKSEVAALRAQHQGGRTRRKSSRKPCSWLSSWIAALAARRHIKYEKSNRAPAPCVEKSGVGRRKRLPHIGSHGLSF